MSATREALLLEIRAKAEELRELMADAESYIDDQHIHATATQDIDELERLQTVDPYRWHADALRNLQAGIMFAMRAVEQPAGF